MTSFFSIFRLIITSNSFKIFSVTSVFLVALSTCLLHESKIPLSTCLLHESEMTFSTCLLYEWKMPFSTCFLHESNMPFSTCLLYESKITSSWSSSKQGGGKRHHLLPVTNIAIKCSNKKKLFFRHDSRNGRKTFADI